MPKTINISHSLNNKTCKEMTDLVLGYVNNQLNSRLKRDFERHLDLCPDCVSFLNTYKKTIQASGSFDPAEMPPRVRDNILNFLRKRIRRLAALLFYLISQLAS